MPRRTERLLEENVQKLELLGTLVKEEIRSSKFTEGASHYRVGGRRRGSGEDLGVAFRFFSSIYYKFSGYALRDTRNADIENCLGSAYRQSGQLPLAFTHYQRALQLDPRHRGAHEYIGEAYLIIGNRAKAEEHLAALRKICLIPCKEYGHLEKKFAEYSAPR